MKSYDVLILGAGGAGMMCAIHAGRRGRRVLLLDHARALGGKILISGGGRCNFTNLGASPAQYVSRNPHFCKSALARYPAQAFIEMVREHGIAFHEKKLGQLFCDTSARDIVDMLEAECARVGAEFWLDSRISTVSAVERAAEGGPPGTARSIARFRVETSEGPVACESLVVATGGLSIPKIGATGLGYGIARQFGLQVVETAPALDGFVFDAEARAFWDLAGVSIDCVVACNGVSFRENILFTHNGLSGPAALQASLHWKPGDAITIDLLPGISAADWFLSRKREGSPALLKNLLAELLPARFATHFCETRLEPSYARLPLAQIPDAAIEALARALHAWRLTPRSTVGYGKAEVTRGGVDTDELSSRTLEAKRVPGLYFIGEVVDVTGWLGGYNFQWAWASGWAAGQVV